MLTEYVLLSSSYLEMNPTLPDAIVSLYFSSAFSLGITFDKTI